MTALDALEQLLTRKKHKGQLDNARRLVGIARGEREAALYKPSWLLRIRRWFSWD